MEMPRPTDAHRALERLVGRWTGAETLHASPWDPKGGTAEARMTIRVGAGGFVVLGDYEQQRDGRPSFHGHAVFRYDPAEQVYALHWFDGTGHAPNVFRGGFEADVLTLTCSRPQGHERLVYDLSEPGRLITRMELSMDGRSWKVFMDGHFVLAG